MIRAILFTSHPGEKYESRGMAPVHVLLLNVPENAGTVRAGAVVDAVAGGGCVSSTCTAGPLSAVSEASTPVSIDASGGVSKNASCGVATNAIASSRNFMSCLLYEVCVI